MSISTRKPPTTPAETLTGFGEDLATLESELDEKERKNEALQNFKNLHVKLTGAADTKKWMAERGVLVLQAKAISDKYFSGGKLRDDVSMDLTTMKVLKIYEMYARSWGAIPPDQRPAGTPDYEARAESIDTRLKANKFEEQCAAEAAERAKQSHEATGTKQARLSR